MPFLPNQRSTPLDFMMQRNRINFGANTHSFNPKWRPIGNIEDKQHCIGTPAFALTNVLDYRYTLSIPVSIAGGMLGLDQNSLTCSILTPPRNLALPSSNGVPKSSLSSRIFFVLALTIVRFSCARAATVTSGTITSNPHKSRKLCISILIQSQS